MTDLYFRQKRVPDRVLRCYLTLACNADCWFCSAGCNRYRFNASRLITPDKWIEFLNRKNRYTVLAGGEPFLYPGFLDVVSNLDKTFKVEIYSNLTCDVNKFVKSVKRKYIFLASLHPIIIDYEKWFKNAALLLDNGHKVRFHIIKDVGWQERVKFLQSKGFTTKGQIKVCDDQNSGVKSNGLNSCDNVICRTGCYLYGPDGFRYPCITKMHLGEDKNVSIIDKSAPDKNFIDSKCSHFGNCCGCDNNIEGYVRAC